MTAFASAAERRVRDLNWQEVMNTAWVFAKVGHKEEGLFMAEAAAAERQMQDLDSQ